MSGHAARLVLVLIAPYSTGVLGDRFHAQLVQILVLPQRSLLPAVPWHGLRRVPVPAARGLALAQLQVGTTQVVLHFCYEFISP